MEQNIGTVPILPGVRNRIAIAGEFTKGPANVARFIGGFTDFADTYGSDIAKGSLGFQAAWDQGARNFMVTRVLGNAKSAAGSATFTGIANKVNTLYLKLSFIGEPVDQNLQAAPLITTAVTTGRYTGSVSGRYYLYVSAVALGIATVKYQFVPLGGLIAPWAGILDSFTVDLAADGGDTKVIEDGVSVTFGTNASPIALSVGNLLSIRVNTYTFTANINEDDIPSQIASSLAESISGFEPFGSVTSEGASIVFALNPSLVEGSLGNRYYYYFELLDETTPGITVTNYTDSNATTFQGGVDGPRIAFRDFYSFAGIPLLRVEALSEGSWGNELSVTIIPITNSQFRLTVVDLNKGNFNPQSSEESFIVSFANTDSTDNYSLTDLRNSKYIKAYFLPQVFDPQFDTSLLNKSPLRLAPPDVTETDDEAPGFVDNYGPTYLTNINLQTGFDGPPVTDNDYINAISKFENHPVHIIITPGIHASKFVKQALISHCLKTDVNDGLRIAVLNSAPNLNPNAAKLETRDFVSDRAVMVTGWSTYAGQPNAPRFGLSPDAVYAGKIASIPFSVQPQAITTSGPAVNIVEVDNQTYNSRASLQIYTDARLEILTLSNIYQAFYFTNGTTLSENFKISTRRTFDVLKMDINDALKFYLSERHTFQLRRQVVTGITSYLNERLAKNEIANFTTPVCDNSNNPPSNYSTGIMNVSFSFLDIAAADYIQVTVSRDNTLGLTQIGV
jgi:hypothetical protein